mmetsp:Transcript_11512/g.30617  ORF Transcript_11512/g.30617 Transcript_11512/m.30617 type:complete len:290 (-) Transcript_11512:1795-2664(-)
MQYSTFDTSLGGLTRRRTRTRRGRKSSAPTTAASVTSSMSLASLCKLLLEVEGRSSEWVTPSATCTTSTRLSLVPSPLFPPFTSSSAHPLVSRTLSLVSLPHSMLSSACLSACTSLKGKSEDGDRGEVAVEDNEEASLLSIEGGSTTAGGRAVDDFLALLSAPNRNERNCERSLHELRTHTILSLGALNEFIFTISLIAISKHSVACIATVFFPAFPFSRATTNLAAAAIEALLPKNELSRIDFPPFSVTLCPNPDVTPEAPLPFFTASAAIGAIDVPPLSKSLLCSLY